MDLLAEIGRLSTERDVFKERSIVLRAQMVELEMKLDQITRELEKVTANRNVLHQVSIELLKDISKLQQDTPRVDELKILVASTGGEIT